MENQNEQLLENQNTQVQETPQLIDGKLPEISFIPANFFKKESEGGAGKREKCALAGIALGAFALVSWIVILFGVLFSIAGIIFSILGLKSSHKKYAQAGLALSIAGLIASVWYVFAAYHGSVNYNYFTSEFWEATSGVETGVK